MVRMIDIWVIDTTV